MREFVDRMGLVMERVGGTRTMGRLHAWLMVCDPPDQSLTDLAAELGVSKTAVSTVARQMELIGMAERVPTAGREHRYRMADGGWTHAIRVQLAGLQVGLDALDFGLSVLPEDRSEPRAQLTEAREFFAFLMQDTDRLVERWEEYREKSS